MLVLTFRGYLGVVALEANHIFSGTEAGVTIRGARHDEEQFRLLTIPEDLRKDIDQTELLDPYLKQSAGPRLFIDAIMGDQPVTPNFYDGLKVQEAIDTALESHRNERWVSLS